MLAILKHELKLYFQSLTAYLIGAFLLIFVGLGAMYYNLEAAISNFEYVLGFSSIVLVVLLPVLTMRSFAEERKQKTDQLLYSLPVSITGIVVGKYLALVVVYLIPLCVVALYPLLFTQYGEVFLPASYGSLFAFFLTGAALIASGIFFSSLTENLGLSAGMSIVAALFNYYSVSLAEYVSATALGSLLALGVLILSLSFVIRYLTRNNLVAAVTGCALTVGAVIFYLVDQTKFEGLLPDLMKQFSLFDRLDTFINGIFDITALVYYLSFIGFFLFLTVQSLEKRRYN